MKKVNNTINVVPSAFTKIDESIQRVLLILILITLIIVPIAGLLLILLGGWQVCSGIVGACYGCKWRMKYLGSVIIYFLIVALTFYLNGDVTFPYDSALVIMLAIICYAFPIMCAPIYYSKIREELPGKDDKLSELTYMGNILDADYLSGK